MKLKEILQYIFSVRNIQDHKQICILGIKFKKRKNELDELLKRTLYSRVPGYSPTINIHSQVEHVVYTSIINREAFSNQRFINYGKDVVVCATGPTFDYYNKLKNCVHIGVNHAYKRCDIDFKSLFCIDIWTVFNGILPKDFMTYRDNDCIKYVGWGTPLSLDVNPKDCNLRYYSADNNFHVLIDKLPLPDFGSIVFAAMSYALWTTPKRIYIVGADCSVGHANSTNTSYAQPLYHLVEPWKLLKEFAKVNYPNTEIISINPVGLKGLFKDVYTQKYIDANPELFKDMQNIEILETGSLV